MEPHKGSVTHWFDQVREGNSVAAQAVWERYFSQLVRLARGKLGEVPRRVEDEEDVAASVMESLFRAAENGRFPNGRTATTADSQKMGNGRRT